MMTKLIIASGNAHKVEEFESLLDGLGFEVCSAKLCGGMPHVVEDGESFAANAQLKAEALRKIAPADAWVLADDSGLEVDALHGAPGIYSARYAGENASDGENLAKLLDAIRQVPEGARGARFRCVLCLIDPDGFITHYDGSCEGRMDAQAHGTEGFGYDPAFIPEGYTKTFGELGEATKSEISHRAKAVSCLRQVISELEL